ncbi:hypothetical protein HanIR_Chr09g0437221 [Helianthus annuus]|nr:hypothetical protein HanIR_Chr09g0437221 [Helianthus annuus]
MFFLFTFGPNANAVSWIKSPMKGERCESTPLRRFQGARGARPPNFSLSSVMYVRFV